MPNILSFIDATYREGSWLPELYHNNHHSLHISKTKDMITDYRMLQWSKCMPVHNRSMWLPWQSHLVALLWDSHRLHIRDCTSCRYLRYHLNGGTLHGTYGTVWHSMAPTTARISREWREEQNAPPKNAPKKALSSLQLEKDKDLVSSTQLNTH